MKIYYFIECKYLILTENEYHNKNKNYLLIIIFEYLEVTIIFSLIFRVFYFLLHKSTVPTY